MLSYIVLTYFCNNVIHVTIRPFHLSFDVIVARSTLAWLMRSIPTPSIRILGIESVCSGFLQKQITISFVFVVLIFLRFALGHFDITLTESCIKSNVEFEVHISNSMPSSTYLYKGKCVLISFTYTRIFKPCNRSQWHVSIWITRGRVDISNFNALGSVCKKSAIRFTICLGKPISTILLTRRLGSIRLKLNEAGEW